MFRKKIDVKGTSLLKTSEKKKFRTSVASAFFQNQAASISKDENDDVDDGAMPSELHFSLVKNDLASTKALIDNGNKQFEFYTLDKTPIFFNVDNQLFPTVYLLWSTPNMLPRIYTHSEVYEKLKTGADLMLPGVLTSSALSSSFDFPSNAVCSICVIGNDAPVAVGRTLMSGAEMLSCEVKKGKAVQILHTYQDSLWDLGPKTRAPNINLPKRPLEKAQDVNFDTEIVDSISENVENTVTLDDAVSADNSTDESVDNDTLFLLYFLYALRKRLRRDDELPILASTFYGNVLLPLMPSDEDKKIAVQRTSYKKFSVFLRRMQDEGVVAIEEPKKGVENIARIYRENEIFGRYNEQLKTLPTSDKVQDGETSTSAAINERPVNFREMRAITASVLPLFQAVNRNSKKGQAMGAADVRSVITNYVKANDLANGRMVKLDDLLLKCTITNSADIRDVGDPVTWEALMESIFNKMTPCVEIEFADQGSTSASGEFSRKEVRKGKPPSIRVRVAKRSGNKKVTMIDNVQAFGIDPKTFAQELQVALAVSATLNDAPGFVGAQVQVQGDQSTTLQKIFVEKYGINKKYLQIG